jgi:hypothetical protein
MNRSSYPQKMWRTLWTDGGCTTEAPPGRVTFLHTTFGPHNNSAVTPEARYA